MGPHSSALSEAVRRRRGAWGREEKETGVGVGLGLELRMSLDLGQDGNG